MTIIDYIKKGLPRVLSAGLSYFKKFLRKEMRKEKTLIKKLNPWHLRLEGKYGWYAKWHSGTYYPKVHFSVLLVYLLIVVFVVSGSIPHTSAATYTKTWTSYNDFNNNKATVNSATSPTAVDLNGSGDADNAAAGSATASTTLPTATYSENFSTTNFLDSANTTANWGSATKAINSYDWTLDTMPGAAGSFNYVDMLVADGSLGFACGDTGIYKTTNAGKTWTLSKATASPMRYFTTMGNTSNLYAAGDNSLLYKSTDGGANWTNMGGQSGMSTIRFSSNLYGVYTGTLNGSGYVFKTDDGGNSWSGVAAMSLAGVTYSDIYFSASDVYLVGDYFDGTNHFPRAWVSNNNGASFVRMGSVIDGYGSLKKIMFTGYGGFAAIAVGTGGRILKLPYSGGVWGTWSDLASGTTEDLYGLDDYSSSSYVIAVGANGTIVNSMDGGATWLTQPKITTNKLKSVSVAANLGGGSIVGDNNILIPVKFKASVAQSKKINNGGSILKTTLTSTQVLNSLAISYFVSADGGVNWEAVTSGVEHIMANPGSDLRWKATMTTDTNGYMTPELRTVSISYSSNGTLSNLKIDAGGLAGWGTLSWNATLQGASSIYFQVRSAVSEAALSTKNWGSPIVTSGLAGNILTSGIANDQWIELQAVFINDGTNVTTLNDFAVTYSINAPPAINISVPIQGTNGSVGASVILSDLDYVPVDYLTTADTKFFYYNGTTKLSGGINSSVTSLTVNDATLLPASGTILIGKEIIQYGSKSGNILNGLTRAVSSSVAVLHDDLSEVYVHPGASLANEGVLATNLSGIAYQFDWNPSVDLPDVYTTGAKIAIFCNDLEAALNISTAVSAAFTLDTKKPITSNPVMTINSGNAKTNSRDLSINFNVNDDSDLLVKLSENADLSGASYTSFTNPMSFQLGSGDGIKTVYAKLCDIYGNELVAIPNDTIELDTTASSPTNFKVSDSSNSDAGKFLATMSWSPIADTDFAIYSIERSTGGDYGQIGTVTTRTNYAYVDQDLTAGVSYSYRMRSRDDIGNWSGYSNVVTIQPGGGDKTPPAIQTGPTPTPDKTSATVVWTTDDSSTSYVEYGATDQYGMVVGNDELTNNHSVIVSGLSSNAQYYYRVKSSDEAGNSITSSGRNFTTLPDNEDNSAPTLQGEITVDKTDTSATISWNTNENSDSFVEYGTTDQYGDTVGDVALTTGHNVTLRNLNPETEYNYRIRSRDNSGNLLIGANNTFTTLVAQNVVDTTAPVITVVPVVSEIKVSGVSVSWSTNEDSDSFIEFGTSIAYGAIQGKDELVKNHTVVLAGLNENTDYHFRVRSRDEAGNLKVGNDGIFTTDKSGMIVTGNIKITGATAQKPGANPEEVTIIWTTDIYATSQVLYGTTEALGLETSEDTTLHKNHMIQIDKLNPNTRYYYRVKSKDEAGNTVFGDLKYFVTSQSESAIPSISNIEISDITLSSAIISWETSVVTTSVVEYGQDINYGSRIEDLSLGSTTKHVVRLKDLSSGTKYHYRVIGNTQDGSDIIANVDSTFSTLALPVISNAKVISTEASKATITWTTNIETDSFVDYGTDNLGLSQGKSEGTLQHSVDLINLKPATEYKIRLKSRDKNGNQANQENLTVKTIADTIPPQIKDLKSETSIITDTSGESKAQIIVSWSTDEPATSLIKYGMSVAVNSDYPLSTKEDTNLTTSHVVIISNLQPSATYHIKTLSRDEAQNTGVSDDYTVLIQKQDQSLVQYIVKILEDKFSWLSRFGLF